MRTLLSVFFCGALAACTALGPADPGPADPSPADPLARSDVSPGGDGASAAAQDAAAPTDLDLERARAVLAAFEDAANRHDRAALEELFDRDVVWFQGSEPVYVGHQAVLDSMAYDAATNVSIRLVPLGIRDGRVHCEIFEANDLFRALGLEGLGHIVDVEIAGDRIRALVSHPPDPEGEASRTIRAFLAWFTEENAPGASPERARRLVELAEAWVAAGRP